MTVYVVFTRYLPDLCGICKVYTELMWYVRVIVVMVFRHFTDVDQRIEVYLTRNMDILISTS